MLDAARGAALVAMAFYHLAYDLQLFGFLPRGTMRTGAGAVSASIIAGSFLFLSGISLALAHGRAIRWRAFWRRWVILALAAGLVSAATWAAIPERFVYFGILHAIAAFSLLGLAVLRLPGAAVLALAAGVLVLPDLWHHDAFNAPWFWWLGLSTERPPSMDFEPLFPWFAPFLAGMAAAGRLVPLAERTGAAGGPPRSGSVGALAWLGRNSLAVYLVHQPLLLGLVWTLAQVFA